MKLIISLFGNLLLAGCAVTLPIGESAKYGEVQVTLVYRPPAITGFPNILNQPTLRDK